MATDLLLGRLTDEQRVRIDRLAVTQTSENPDIYFIYDLYAEEPTIVDLVNPSIWPSREYLTRYLRELEDHADDLVGAAAAEELGASDDLTGRGFQ